MVVASGIRRRLLPPLVAGRGGGRQKAAEGQVVEYRAGVTAEPPFPPDVMAALHKDPVMRVRLLEVLEANGGCG